MTTLTPIEFVRAIRENNHRYGAVDKDTKAYSYPDGLKPIAFTITFNNEDVMSYLGTYNLACSWKETLIDVTKILVR